MKIVIFAHQNWGIKGIEILLKTNHEIIQVFTHPLNMDKHEKVWYESVVDICTKNNIPILEKTKTDEEIFNLIKSMCPDLILCLGWRRLIPKTIFEFPIHGTINFHDGLLPEYRGFAPVNWCIINDEKFSGITAHYLDDDVDTGDIILQEKVPINDDDTAKMVYEKLLEIYPNFLINLLDKITSKNINKKIQNRLDGFTCSRRFPHDGKINWNDDRKKIHNLIRALSYPYPNAFFISDDKKFFINKSCLLEEDFRGPSGRICKITSDGIVILCGTDHTKNQALEITELVLDEKIVNPSTIFKKLWLDLE
jgi:methionyl-tRNA formyltransferase